MEKNPVGQALAAGWYSGRTAPCSQKFSIDVMLPEWARHMGPDSPTPHCGFKVQRSSADSQPSTTGSYLALKPSFPSGGWDLAKELHLSYCDKQTISLTIDPYYGNLHEVSFSGAQEVNALPALSAPALVVELRRPTPRLAARASLAGLCLDPCLETRV